MFFVLSKILLFLLSPFLWLVVLVFLSFTVKSQEWKKKLMWTALAFFIFFTNPFIIASLVKGWENKATNIDEVSQYDVGIVLSGMMEYNSDVNRLTARRGTDRIWQAITLYKKGKIKKILISGDNGYVLSDDLHESTQLKNLLVSWGIPEQDILIEEQSRNTHENAIFTTELLLKEFPNGKFLLITSSLHMKRAQACFEHEGLQFDTFSTDHYYEENKSFTLNSLIPSIESFVMWDRFNKEWVGYLAYWIMDYL